MNQEPRRQNQNTTAQRLRAMDRRWKREKRVLRLISLFLALVIVVLFCVVIVDFRRNTSQNDPDQPTGGEPNPGATTDTENTAPAPGEDNNHTVHFLAVGDNIIHDDFYADARQRGDGEYLFTPMYEGVAEEIANDMWTRSEGRGEVMLSGQNTAYLMERGLGMLKRVQFVGNHYQIIHSPAEVPEDITKVSVYLHEGVENYVERFVPRWKQANCAVAGPYWIDTTFANKGIGAPLASTLHR